MVESRILTDEKLESYQESLRQEEKSKATIAKYYRDVRKFCAFLAGNRVVNKEVVLRYKQELAESYHAVSANSMLVALNGFFTFCGWNECKVKLLKIQRKCFREQKKELTKQEYQRLIMAAQSSENERLNMLLQTICSTGIRVSEHRFITVESLQCGETRINNKGKERVIMLPRALCRKLKQYCRRNGISAGSVFVTRTGKPLDRSNIWHEMKRLCQTAGVNRDKVFPHNLRHLFAITYYQLEKDIVRLADMLGYASIDTTRIYTFTTGAEHRKALSRLNLLI